MKCINCEHYDHKEELCSLEPSEIESEVCLLRWVIGLLLEEQDDGENWKF
jgi:hypothetical protein